MDVNLTQDALELTYIEELEPKTAPSGGGETVLPLPVDLDTVTHHLKRH